EVVAADFEEAGDRDVVRKVMTDLAAKGIAITEAELRTKMNELMAQAIAQVKAGK
ncbi:MAG: ATPase inhibitor subunit zeta, partial [Xanthobacteraceae bacterium]